MSATLLNEPIWSIKWAYTKQPGEIEFPSESNVTRMPQWLFVSSNGARVMSRPPVDVEVTKVGPDEEYPEPVFIFACEKLHVFASASSYRAAEDLFHDQIVHFYYVYRNASRDELADDAAAIKSLYDANFVESQPPVR